MQQQPMKIHAIYASQTGTAIDLLKQFISVIQVQKVINFEQLEQIKYLSTNILWIFFISTTGQGDMPNSMKKQWKQLMKKNHPKLINFKFTIYALGDTSYGQNYNLAGRKFRQRMLMLQAIEVIQIGLGNQQDIQGYSQVYQNIWLPKLKNYLSNQNQSINHNSISILEIQSHIIQLYYRPKCQQFIIKQRKQICSNYHRKTYTITLSFSKQLLHIPQIGDILNIYPQNQQEQINFMLKYFNLSSNMQYTISNYHFTIQQLLKKYINLSGTVNHSFFKNISNILPLSTFVSNQLYKDKLQHIAYSYDQYFNYIKKYKRNIIQLIKDFNLQIPFKQFIYRINWINKRKYSIAGINYNNLTIKLLIRLVEKQINQNRFYKGVCSHDLVLSKQKSIRMGYIEHGSFQLNCDKLDQLVIITLGTGIAPFLPIFQSMLKNDKIQHTLLFYSNRFKNQVYFEQLIMKLVQIGKMTKHITFTKQNAIRIQIIIEKQKQQFIKLNKLSNYKIMICGPKDFYTNIVTIILKYLTINEKDLLKQKILIYENW